MRGLRVSVDGNFEQVELSGPSRFELWSDCYRVFRTAAIMLDLCTPSTLDSYRDHIRRYSRGTARGYGVSSTKQTRGAARSSGSNADVWQQLSMPQLLQPVAHARTSQGGRGSNP